MWFPLLCLLATAPPALPLTFDGVITGAEAHPRLSAQDAALKVQRVHNGAISRLSANPQLQVLPGWRLPGSSDPGFEIQFSLSHTFDLGGIGARRQEAAAAELAEMSSDRRRDALAARLDAARAWLGLWARQTQMQQIEEERDLAVQLAQRVRRAVELGAAVEPDAAEAQLFAENLARSALDAEGLTYEQALGLAGALGLSGAEVPHAEGAPPPVALPEARTWPQWIARAQELPSSRSAQLRAQAAQARAAEAKAQDSTRLTPTLNAQMERPNDVLVFAGLGVQLPLFHQNAQAAATASAQATRAQRDATLVAIDAERALRLTLHEVTHTREIEDHVRQRILPTVQTWVEQTTRRFEAGETDVFTVLRARGRLVEIRHTLLSAEEERRWAEVKAWLLLASLPQTQSSR